MPERLYEAWRVQADRLWPIMQEPTWSEGKTTKKRGFCYASRLMLVASDRPVPRPRWDLLTRAEQQVWERVASVAVGVA